MASIWKGAVTFGLVNIPVHLESAVRSDEHISFRQLHKDDLSPIKYERVCQKDGASVPWGEIVKGYEYSKGKFIVITDEELESAAVASSHAIDILDFVAADAVDPRHFETPYFLLPNPGAEKAYALLREAIRTTGMIGIGKLTLRQRQHVVAIKAVGDALVLEIMRLATELVDASTFSFPAAAAVRPQELRMAEQLVQSLADDFAPEKYTDEYRENLMTIIKAKMKGKTVEFEQPEALESTTVLDLMARLEASLAQGRGKGSGAVRRAPRTAAASERKPARRSRQRQSA